VGGALHLGACVAGDHKAKDLCAWLGKGGSEQAAHLCFKPPIDLGYRGGFIGFAHPVAFCGKEGFSQDMEREERLLGGGV